jgi:hypothetical protein
MFTVEIYIYIFIFMVPADVSFLSTVEQEFQNKELALAPKAGDEQDGEPSLVKRHGGPPS